MHPARRETLCTLKLHMCLKIKPGPFHPPRKKHASKILMTSHYYWLFTIVFFISANIQVDVKKNPSMPWCASSSWRLCNTYFFKHSGNLICVSYLSFLLSWFDVWFVFDIKVDLCTLWCSLLLIRTEFVVERYLIELSSAITVNLLLALSSARNYFNIYFWNVHARLHGRVFFENYSR